MPRPSPRRLRSYTADAMLQHTIKAVIRPGDESGHVAECVEVAVVTEGGTLAEVTRNLREAVAPHREGEDPASFGLAPNPTVLVAMELPPAHAWPPAPLGRGDRGDPRPMKRCALASTLIDRGPAAWHS
jgi:hypothetical protein